MPAVLIRATASNGLKSYIPVLFKGGDRLITAERPAPEPGKQTLFEIVALRLHVPVKSTRIKGKTVGFIEAPLSCPGGKWRFS